MRISISLLLLYSAFVCAAQNHQSTGQSSYKNFNRSAYLTPFRQGDKWGYADKCGHTVIRPQFSVAHDFSEGLAMVYQGGVPLDDPIVKSFVKMGYIDEKGHWVVHSRFKDYYCYDFSDGLVPFRRLSKGWGYLNTKGKIAVQPRFQWAGTFANGMAPVVLNDKCGHIDRSGRLADQAPSALPRRKGEQDGHGTFVDKPQTPPCL